MRYLDREFSALEFNARVLAESKDLSLPLLERLKFVGIVSSNLDEFYMVRVASLQNSQDQLDSVRDKARTLGSDMNRTFMDHIVPELQAAGFLRLTPDRCTPTQLDYLRLHFANEIFPVLTPIALSSERPFPPLRNLKLHLVLSLKDNQPGGPMRFAAVEIPQKSHPRILFLPTEKDFPFILMEDLISHFVSELFPGYEIVETGLMRLTRGAEITLDEEKEEDFLHVMSEALQERRQAEIVRLEVSAHQAWVKFLQQSLQVSPQDIQVNPGWFDIKSIAQLALQPGFEPLKRPAWEPCLSPDFKRSDNVWTLMRQKSVLLMHPYESFEPVIDFLDSAADDPDVLAIKQTLYRTDPDSRILGALERAAENGKRVTVLVELKARFDEESNIEWAKRLMHRGASVLYGIAGYKTHAKACLVIRREQDGIKRYVHLSTGNYNARTARLYSDIGYLTSDEAMAGDLAAFFNMITGYSQPASWKKIEVAPFGLRRKLLRLIRRETMRRSAEKPGLIRLKMNSLVDTEIIEALYEASRAGVRVQLNVRGICCLRPGLKGLSDHIQVVSIVDQFLEHSRIYYFENDGDPEVYLSSADLMPRNLDKRIEILFPVEDAPSKKRLIEALDLYFRDTVKSWILLPDGSYVRSEAGSRKKLRAQDVLCQRALEEQTAALKAVPGELKPQRPTVATTYGAPSAKHKESST